MRRPLLRLLVALALTAILCGVGAAHARIGTAVENAPQAVAFVGKIFAKLKIQRYSATERDLIRSGTQASVKGRAVIKRNQTLDPHAKDALGRTNIQRMREGFAPIGRDGKPVELHHMGQKNDGLLVEITNTQHRANTADLHRYNSRSEIDRPQFNAWKKEYWKQRAEDFR